MQSTQQSAKKQQPDTTQKTADSAKGQPATEPREVGGRKGPEPTRFGDWERNGRCIDF